MPRNPIPAKLFRSVRLAENAGTGFTRMIRGWKSYKGLAPVFTQEVDYTVITFWLSSQDELFSNETTTTSGVTAGMKAASQDGMKGSEKTGKKTSKGTGKKTSKKTSEETGKKTVKKTGKMTGNGYNNIVELTKRQRDIVWENALNNQSAPM